MFEELSDSSGVRVKPDELVGHLLLVWAVEYIAHSPTKYSRPDRPSDVIVVDVVDLDVELEGECLVVRRSWWRNARLIQSLRPKLGRIKPSLARMGKEASSFSNDAYVLVSMTADPACVARAEAWMTAHPDFTPSETFQAATPAVPQQVQRPAPVAAPEPPRQPTLLERLAAQSARAPKFGGSQLPPPPPQPDEPPF
jgi:hypothetical protein